MGSTDEYENFIFHIDCFLHFEKLQPRFKNSAELEDAIASSAVYLAHCLHFM